MRKVTDSRPNFGPGKDHFDYSGLHPRLQETTRQDLLKPDGQDLHDLAVAGAPTAHSMRKKKKSQHSLDGASSQSRVNAAKDALRLPEARHRRPATAYRLASKLTMLRNVSVQTSATDVADDYNRLDFWALINGTNE